MGRGKAIVGALAALALLGGACTNLAPLEGRVGAVEAKLSALEGKVGKIAVPAGDKHFYVTGVEWKGSTTAKDLAPPQVNPKDLSDGYGFKGPGVFDASNPDKWEVASYVWTPGSMIAYQGDKVTMTFFIINGNKHSTWVEGPDGAEVAKEVEMNRGREYTMSFTVSKVGVYRLVCNEHEPTMTAYILVLPRS